MTSPDTAFAEGTAKNNISFNFGVGVFGVASICVPVFVVLLCANKDRNSKSKKISNDSRQCLLDNQLAPARHGIENKTYTVVENGIGECILSRNESSVSRGSRGSSPKGAEGRSQNSVSQSPLSPHLTQHSGLREIEQAIYDIPRSKEPTQTMPIVSEKNHILFESNQSEVNSNPLPCETKVDSDSYIPEHPADNLYFVPKSNKPRDEKKPIPLPKMFKRSKEDRMCANDLVMTVPCELPNRCDHARSMHTYLNLIPTFDGEKYDDILHEPCHGRTEENLIPISASREGKLLESISKSKENKFQYTVEGTKQEDDTESLYLSPKSYKSTGDTRSLGTVNLREAPEMKSMGPKNLQAMTKTTFPESVQGPDMPVCKQSGNNRKEILTESDYVCAQATSLSPRSVKCSRAPLLRSEAMYESQFKLVDAADRSYNVLKSNRTCNDRKPFFIPTLEQRTESTVRDDTSMKMESTVRLKEPHAQINRFMYTYATPDKREILEQECRYKSSLSDKQSEQPLILSPSISDGSSKPRIATNESQVLTESYSESDTKTHVHKEADMINDIYKSVIGKRVQNMEENLKGNPKLVSSRGDIINDGESYIVLLMNRSDINSSLKSTKCDSRMYRNDMFPFPEMDPPLPPTPCRFTYRNVPMTIDQKMSMTNCIDTETEEHVRYINCKEFPNRSENLDIINATDLCPPAPCSEQRYINMPHTSGKELVEDNEYVPMNNHDDVLDKQTREYVNLRDSPVLLTTEKTSNIYLPMTKHLTHANSDTYIYQNTKWKGNKTMYVNSLSFESSLNGCHDSEKDDVYCYASADFFLKNKMAADTANKFGACINKDVCINEGDCINEVQNTSVKAVQFLTATSAKEMDVRSQTSKSQKLDETVFVSNTVPAGKQT